MIPYAQLTPGPGWKPIQSFLYYSQRAVGWERPRKFVVNKITSRIQRSDPVYTGQVPIELALQGLMILPQMYPTKAIDEMVQYLQDKDVVLRSGISVNVNDIPPGEPFVNFPLSTVVNCPHVMDIANDHRFLSIATDYLKCRPTISSIGIRWSYPNSKSTTVQGWHRDNDDWKYVKFFMYLTDVDEDSGPHIFIRRSHRESLPIKSKNYTDEYLSKHYGSGRIKIIGQRGTMFMADTSGIHKGEVPTRKPRLMLEVGYSLLPIYAFKYTPEVLESVRSINRYTNRLIVKGQDGK
jgi:hypothetical protein